MKTSELTGAALDWAVAWCERKLITLLCGVMVRDNDGMLSPTKSNPLVQWSPTTDWAQGGPIIEREGITVTKANSKGWTAQDYTMHFWGTGPTPLVAAMRCYVAGKLGDEVEVPCEQ